MSKTCSGGSREGPGAWRS